MGSPLQQQSSIAELSLGVLQGKVADGSTIKTLCGKIKNTLWIF
jgi:hypothetical protein